jgi:hypothetical protein
VAYYYDYIWDLNPDQLILDRELDTKKLGWQTGDVFVLVEGSNNQKFLRRMDQFEKFVRGIGNA